MWRHGRKSLAVALQNRMSEVFAVDIHPAARMGWGVLIDHATGGWQRGKGSAAVWCSWQMQS